MDEGRLVRARLDEHSQVLTMDEDWVRNGIRHYLGMVSLIDQRIGDVLATLERLGRLDDRCHALRGGRGHQTARSTLYRKSPERGVDLDRRRS